MFLAEVAIVLVVPIVMSKCVLEGGQLHLLRFLQRHTIQVRRSEESVVYGCPFLDGRDVVLDSLIEEPDVLFIGHLACLVVQSLALPEK